MASDKKVSSVSVENLKDPELRRVLEPLFQGWNVRNAGSATGDDAQFITRAELRKWASSKDFLTGQFEGKGFGSGGGASGGPTKTQEWVKGIISGVQDLIRGSEFFQSLGQQIERLKVPINAMKLGLDKMQTVIYEEITNRFNSTEAIVVALNQIFAGIPGTDGKPAQFAMDSNKVTVSVTGAAALGENIHQVESDFNKKYVVVEQKFKTLATVDGKLVGSYTVKIDADGFVSGFGLSSTTEPGGSELSEFYIRADRFAIGSPVHPSTQGRRPVIGYVQVEAVDPITGDIVTRPEAKYAPASNANVPFVVLANPTDIIGPHGMKKTVPAGAYMDNAFIQTAAIGTAKIGFAAVDTLEVAGQAITIPMGQAGSYGAPASDYNSGQLCSMTFPNSQGRLYLFASASAAYGSGGNGYGPTLTIYAGGGAVAQTVGSLTSSVLGISLACAGIYNSGTPGPVSCYVEVSGSGCNRATTWSNVTLVAIDLKR
jgi:hypothetical protein